MSRPVTRTISVAGLTRVEGEGALHVRLEQGAVADVQLSIYEPPRFFEALLRGRAVEETPDITARICGICPIAYQMTSVHALEQALGIDITPEIRQLRRLLYCGEWIESHGVHMFLLHIPDFFDCPSCIELAQLFPAEVNRGLQLKKIGNRLVEICGGRATHPVNVTVGGFYRAPDRQQLRGLCDELKWALDTTVELTRWIAGFDFPQLDRPCEMIALQHPDEYPMNEGRIASTDDQHPPIAVDEFEHYFAERQVPHSTALQANRIPQRSQYFVGPLARMNLNRQQLLPVARQLSAELGVAWPCFNPYQSILARAVEIAHALEEALQIISHYQTCSPARVAYQPRAGSGAWATEAPRGMIYHRYETTEDGKIRSATIIPPTSQNQFQIETDLRLLLPQVLDQDDAAIALACEKLIRAYDPCISCATHFLRLHIQRQ